MKLHRLASEAVFALFLAVGAGQTSAFAQTATTAPLPASSKICYAIPSDIHYGASDIAMKGEVTDLQNFLVTQGYFNTYNVGTGHFGPITLKAVMQFQAAQSLPTTGFVGPLTRASIQSISCSNNGNPPPSSSMRINSITPTSGATGTSVSITGYGFTDSNTILFNGYLAARNVPISSTIAMGIACFINTPCHNIIQTLTFNVPSSLSANCLAGSACPLYAVLVTPGQYNVTVQNTNGTSNGTNYTVTSGTSNNSLSINGLDAPSSLSIGQSGTWTLHVTAGSNSGNLHYSVVWGDETSSPTSIMASQSGSVQNSSTFTHTYQRSGTYSPTFTVTDDTGTSISTTNTLNVSPLYY